MGTEFLATCSSIQTDKNGVALECSPLQRRAFLLSTTGPMPLILHRYVRVFWRCIFGLPIPCRHYSILTTYQECYKGFKKNGIKGCVSECMPRPVPRRRVPLPPQCIVSLATAPAAQRSGLTTDAVTDLLGSALAALQLVARRALRGPKLALAISFLWKGCGS